VYSTLHTNSALGAIPRLLDIGVQPEIMAGNIIGIVAQRLIRQLCEFCKEPYLADTQESHLLGIRDETPPTEIYRATGCPECAFQGYQGRLAIMELLRFDDGLDELISRRASLHEIRQYVGQRGFTTLADDGFRQVLNGHTSLAELARVVDLGHRV
jgi:general secretion pathway protein E/type IV pilus assembly protein PilB